jgi:hypothetical protein
VEYIIPLLFIPLLFLGFAVLTNLYREHREYKFELKPNCLLTRKPVVFITGPRSVFYFRKYWNAYPEILAEHGYEVFTLHLPWRGQARLTKMRDFLQHHDQRAKRYHFICDEYSFLELREPLEQSPCVTSITVLKKERAMASKPAFAHRNTSVFLAWSYKLHSWSCFSLQLPTAEDLGLQFPTSAPWLLTKMQENGEQDFLS